MTSTNSFTADDIFYLKQKVLLECDVIDLGNKATSKIFLQNLLKLSESSTFKEVEQKYRESKVTQNLPEDEDDFWEFIAKEYLKLKTEPRQEFLSLSLEVSKDLARIREHLKYIHDEKKCLHRKRKIPQMIAIITINSHTMKTKISQQETK